MSYLMIEEHIAVGKDTDTALYSFDLFQLYNRRIIFFVCFSFILSFLRKTFNIANKYKNSTKSIELKRLIWVVWSKHYKMNIKILEKDIEKHFLLRPCQTL